MIYSTVLPDDLSLVEAALGGSENKLTRSEQVDAIS